ncbi:MAG: hypothetical protein ACXWB0_08935 [Sulfuricurvum sp.]
MRHSISLTLALFAFGGCANHAGVTPSQNPALNTLSPSTTAVSEGGVMQRNLDGWLKEEWTPLTTTPSQKEEKGTQAAIPKEELDSRLRGNDESNTSFGLQKYVDKWKKYHENKDKMNEGKPKEASNVENLEKLPVIGK